MNTETKVGLFTLAGTAVFAGVVLLLGDISFQSSYRAHAVFDNAEGLPVNGSVKVAGVEVGKVEKIELENQRAFVTLKMNKGVEVRKNARARVASTGLIGSKYLDMTLGNAPEPLLGEGDVIQGDPTFTFDEMMTKLGQFFEEDPQNGAVSDNLKITIANLRRVSDALNDALGKQKAEMGEIVRNIRDMTRHIAEITSERKEDVKVALAKIRSVSERLDDILARVQSGGGILGKLVGDEEMGKDLKQTMTSVKDAAKDAQSIMGRIARVDVFWDYRQRYDFEDDRWKVDVGMKFVPRPGKFYFVGGNNLGKRRDRREPGADIERRNTISALMGWEIRPAGFSAGVIRSAGGVAASLRPLPGTGRVELEAQAYDFGRDETVQGVRMKGPIYNAGLRVKALKQPAVWLGAGVEDAAERKNVVGHVNVSFKDEDIAYLLGLVGLAR